MGAWGRGFVLALSRRGSQPERAYRAWHRNHETPVIVNLADTTISVPVTFALGEAQLVAVEPQGLYVANIIGQEGVRRDGRERSPVRYDAIRLGLERVRFFAIELGASVHMPRIGAGLAGGRWNVVEAIVRDELATHDISVTIYDLPADHRR